MSPTTIYGVQTWIAQVARLIEQQRCNCPTFFRPYHFVVLALQLAQHRANSLGLPAALQQYAARMQLWESIGLESPVTVTQRDPLGRFVPLVRLEQREAIWDTAKQLAEITSTYGADERTTDAVATSMSEIMENCFAHARVEAGLTGLACAQSWPQGNLAQIALADKGIGIRSSLQENPDLWGLLNEGNSCEIATRLGITSKPDLGHAGYGLALTRQLLERAGGRLIVVSGSEWVQAYGERCTTGTLPSPWQGTIAVLEWKTNRPLRLKDVYDSWPLPTGFEHDDFDL